MEGDIASYFSISQMLRSSAVDLATIFLLTVILVPSAIADYREEKIPNYFSMAGWVAGPAMHFWLSGMDGLLHASLGFGLLFGLTFPLWLIKWFGAADVKLIASVGAIVGGIQALSVLVGIFIFGFIMALLRMVVKGEFTAMLRAIYFWPAWSRGGDDVTKADRGSQIKKGTIPYAVPIAFGSLLTILYMHM